VSYRNVAFANMIAAIAQNATNWWSTRAPSLADSAERLPTERIWLLAVYSAPAEEPETANPLA
jgi:hypothetical protein